MKLPRLGLLLAALHASSKEAIAAGSDGPFLADVQDGAIFAPARTSMKTQTEKTKMQSDPANDDSIISNPTTPSAHATTSPTNNLRHLDQSKRPVDRRLEGYVSSFAGPFIDDLLHRQDHLRHSKLDHSSFPDKPDVLTHRLLRGGLPMADDEAPDTAHMDRRLATLSDTLLVKDNTDDVANPAEYSLRWAINALTTNPPPSGEYRLIEFDCESFATDNVIALKGDLTVTKDDVAIDATKCTGGITLKDGKNTDIDNPTLAAPVLYIEGSRFIYRGMTNVRVPILVDGYQAKISHNHLQKYSKRSFDVQSAEGAITLRSYQSHISYNEISDNKGYTNAGGIYVTGALNTGNKIYNNDIHDNYYGVRVMDFSGAEISQNRIVDTSSEIYHGSGQDPDSPILKGTIDGVPITPPTCNPSDGSVNLTAIVPSSLQAGEYYTVEFFSLSSTSLTPSGELDHYVGKITGTSTDATDSHTVTLPCIIGNSLFATITVGGQTSDISHYAQKSSTDWANSCQCSLTFQENCDLNLYDMFCPTSDGVSGANPYGVCVSTGSKYK